MSVNIPRFLVILPVHGLTDFLIFTQENLLEEGAQKSRWSPVAKRPRSATDFNYFSLLYLFDYINSKKFKS